MMTPLLLLLMLHQKLLLPTSASAQPGTVARAVDKHTFIVSQLHSVPACV
jgi:hypothetical protein